MAKTSSTALPTLDYVSIVASLYKDRRAMLLGMAATILAVIAAAVRVEAAILYVHALAFCVSTAMRYANAVAFEHRRPAADDREGARFWERQQMLQGTMSSLIYGSWCFCSFVFVRDPFAEMVALTVTIAAMIGISTRNFGIDRIVTAQSVAISVPIIAGLMIAGDAFHAFFALLLLPTLASFRFLAADVRAMLLSAVHERMAASSLAEQLDTALDTMQHGLCMLDNNGVITLANDRSQQNFARISEGCWVGREFSELLDEAVARRALPRVTADRLDRMIAQQIGGKIVMQLSGDYHCEVTVSSRGDRTVLLLENVSERIRAQERINFMARFDMLTGLPNRAYFTEQVEADLAMRSREDRRRPAMLAIIDLDEFKQVNDTLGHLAGDKVLAEAAARIQTVMNRQSRLGRLGGDEFVVYRDEDASEATAQAEAAVILSALSRPFEIDGRAIDMRASIGFVIEPGDEVGLDDLVRRADLALYRAKSQGKGRYHAFLEEMDSAFRYRQRLKGDLAVAVAQGQLRLVYQPLVDARTRQVVGCEALARWTHPELGPIAPNVFIGLAEEVGLVSDITRWVLTTATAECANWPDPLTVAVNVSARDLRGEGLSESIARALEASGLDARRLEIEVTETALIEERDVAAQRLGVLAGRGIGIALDDFGTGYSSLSYLQSMPFTKLKIDRSFIADIATDPNALRLVANLATLGKDLGLKLTAEGIETEDQADLLTRQTRVDQLQGYLFAMPLPGEELRELLSKVHRDRGPTAPAARPAIRALP